MSVKRILLVLSGSVADGAAAHAAFHIAGRFGAQVDALHVEGDIADGLPYIELSLSEGALTREFAKARERQEGAAQWAREIFEAARREAGAEDGGVGWRTTRGRAADVVGSEGRVYDLTVIGAKADFAGASAGEVVTAALLETGHPVLVVPDAGQPTLGQRILVGWNRGTPAARAVAAALPFLGAAAEVVVAYIGTGAKAGPGPKELCVNLAAHGIEAIPRQIAPVAGSVAQGLRDAAEAAGADLMIMGAYSHSRLTEMVLGGVTSEMLEHSPIPLLMAH